MVEKESSTTLPPEYNTFKETREHTIYDFLKRPRLIDNLQWSSASGPFTLLATYNIPDVTVATRMIADKLSDFRFWRWTTVLRFVLNINRFSIGKIIAVVEPAPTLTSGNRNFQSLTALTAYPHIFMDAGTAPTAELRIPYVARRAAYDSLYDLNDPWATVSLYVFNTLTGTTGSTIGYISTYVHCEDISVSIPTWNQITAFGPPSALRDVMIAKSNTEPMKDSTLGALTKKVQSASTTARSVASVGKGILKDLAAAEEWIAELAPNLLTFAGFSKPTNLQLTAPMIQQPCRGLSTWNGPDNSVPLCANYKNSLSVNNKIFGTTIDEMDISYVCSKPNFLETFNIADTAAPGTVLKSWPISPGFTAQNTLTTQVNSTQLAYVTSMFKYWRGGINLKFDFVANQFYSMRIGVAYFSGLRTIDIPGSIAIDEIDMVPKVVCDLKNTMDCTFNIPWSMHTPYLQTRIASRNSTGTGFTFASLDDPNYSLGTVVMYVINPLVHPAQVPGTIPVNVFIYADKDIEFEDPSFHLYGPVSTPIPAFTDSEEYLIAMSNSTTMNLNTEAASGLPDHSLLVEPSKISSAFAQASIGEKITSLRQITRMFSTTLDSSITATKSLTVDPAYFQLDNPGQYNCPRSRISRLYAFYKGSHRLKFAPKNVSQTTFPLFYVTTIPSGANQPAPPDVLTPGTNPGNIGFQWFANLAQNPVLETSTPFYTKDYLGVVSDLIAPPRNLTRIWLLDNSTAANFNLYESAGDDFTFGWLKAPPNLRLYP